MRPFPSSALVISQTVKARGWRVRVVPSVCSVASAYYWMADEAGTHPLDPTLPASLTLLGAMAALMTVAVPFAALTNQWQSDDQSTGHGET